MDSISFLPSILWSAIGLWLGTVMCSFLYMRYVKSRHPNSRIRLDGDSFLVKTFLVASSLISIFSIGTSVQFFNPSAGLDQFFVIFVLVVWLKYALSDLKQKLDSFVVPKTLKEKTQTPIVPPPPPPPVSYGVEEKETMESAVAGADQLLRVLREFTNRWEQYKQLDMMQRWASQGDVQKFAKQASSRLVVLVSRYAESWDLPLRNFVRTISDDLQKLAFMPVSDIAPGDWLLDMIKQGDRAYQRTQALISSLVAKQP